MCSYKYTVLVNNQSCPNLPGGTRHPFQVDAPYLLSIGILEPRRNQDKLICCCLIPQFKRVVIPCPVPWLNSDLGNKEGVCDLGPPVPERWLGEMGGDGAGWDGTGQHSAVTYF